MVDSSWPTPQQHSEHPLADLPLRDWRPRRRVVLDEHEVPVPRFPVVDAHNHLGRWLTGDWSVPDVAALLDQLDECGVATIINLDGRWGEELAANLARYDHAHPGRFATFCHVDWAALQNPSASAAAGELAADLRRSVAAGARGLKVWKDLGLHVRDHAGALVGLDDPRLGPLFDAAGELGIPVAIHTADPVAFFDPIDAHNERLEQLLAYPDWSYADTARFPRFEALVAALETVVAGHPRTRIIGVHAGCFPEDLGWVRRMLASYPNFLIDVAARLAELGRQPRATRRLVLDFPDRVLFGTDCFPPSTAVYRRHFRFFESADEGFPHEDEDPSLMGRWTISGLDLPDDALAAVYAGNARRLLGG